MTIEPTVMTHFTHKTADDKWEIACMPGLKDFTQMPNFPNAYHRSNDIRAVTCLSCKKSAVYITVQTSRNTM